MKNSLRQFLILSACFCFVLGACNLPWESEASQAVPAVVDSGPAPTAVPASDQPARLLDLPDRSETALPAPLQGDIGTCDKAQFVSDVTVPDGSTFSAGDSFTKTWKLKNVGSCTWTTSYVLAFESGDRLSGLNVKPLTRNVAPGAGINVSVDLTAPGTVGSYRGYWQLRNADGDVIPVENGYSGRSFYVDIRVTPPQQGSGQQASIAVTSVTFSVSHTGFCGRGITYEIQADITTNGAGKVDYQWIHSHAGNHELPKLLMFNSAGTQTVTTEYKPGSSPPFSGMWMDLYINDPNNQQFGRADLDCP